MASQFAIRRQVEFAETDMAGIMHFSNFFRYMEATETAFFRSLGLTLIAQDGDQLYGWPRVRASCDYHHPLRFGETVEVRLFVKEIKIRAIVYAYRFKLIPEQGDPVAVARGEMTTVCATRNARTGALESRSLPADVLAQLQEATPEQIRAD
jgi:acyl-CoA thioester hydrolase